jgi:hypothetical protein
MTLIAANLTRIYKNLITSPITVRTATSYGTLGYPKVKFTVFQSLCLSLNLLADPCPSMPTLLNRNETQNYYVD